MENLIAQVPSNCLVIADAKRGDIGNTASKYAQAIFDNLGADAITVAPYMGADSVTPFTDRKNKWTILLALTSNPGADDFEFHGSTPLFETVLTKAQTWGTPDNLMFVVGATRPDLNNFLTIPYMPCTMSFIHFNKEYWKEIKQGDGLLEAYMSPKILNENNEKN